MATAAWLFVRAVARCAGDEGVAELAADLGETFTVLEAVAHRWLAGSREASTDPSAVLDALGNATRLVVVGLEAAPLDELVRRVPSGLKIAMIAHSQFPVDWGRIFDNYGGGVERVDLDTFQTWAGPRSALLTFAYGRHDTRTCVRPLWLRACGADVRAQFRSLIGWDILGAPLEHYPRWLVETETTTFTHFVS